MTRNSFVRNQLPAIVWAGLIFTGSSIPGFSTPPLGLFSLDKIAHFFEFGIFGFLLARAMTAWPRIKGPEKTILFASLTGISWALLDEFHQMFVRGRNASVYDFLADALGVLAAQFLYVFLLSRRNRKQS